MFTFFLMLFVSFLHSMFMSKIFNWSDDILIRTIQKTFFYSIFSSIVIVIFNYLGLNLIGTIHCDSEDEDEPANNSLEGKNKEQETNKNVFEVKKFEGKDNKDYYKIEGDVEKKFMTELGDRITDVIKTGIKDVAPNLGAAAAGGSLGSAIIKATAGLPPVQRIGLGAGATFLGAGAAKLGLEGATSLSKNLELSSSIKNTKSDKTEPDQIPSPDDTNFSINSPLDEADIPLLGLINSILNLNIIELIIIIFILFIKYQDKIKKIFLNKIIFYINNNIPALKKAKYVRVSHFLNSLLIVNSRFNKIIIVYFIILLILIKILNIYFLYNLNLGIDDFVLVYNYIKKGFS